MPEVEFVEESREPTKFRTGRVYIVYSKKRHRSMLLKNNECSLIKYLSMTRRSGGPFDGITL